MEIQLITPLPTISTTTTSTPYTIAPSTPHHFPNFYYSAPTTPIHTTFQREDDDEFAFEFSGQLDPPSISDADELFHCGQIKTTSFSQEKNSKYFIDAFYQTPSGETQPTQKISDYFTNAFYQTCGGKTQLTQNPRERGRETATGKDTDCFIEAFYQTTGGQTQNPPKRGRETTSNTKRTRDKASRSSSPFRISDILTGEDTDQKTWYNKWNLKNLLLFRSTSEGSARTRKDVLTKYSRIRKGDEDGKNSSFRSLVGCRRVVSAHEMHYTANRAVAEELRRKTYLPYKSGLLGCLGFRNGGASLFGFS